MGDPGGASEQLSGTVRIIQLFKYVRMFLLTHSQKCYSFLPRV